MLNYVEFEKTVTKLMENELPVSERESYCFEVLSFLDSLVRKIAEVVVRQHPAVLVEPEDIANETLTELHKKLTDKSLTKEKSTWRLSLTCLANIIADGKVVDYIRKNFVKYQTVSALLDTVADNHDPQCAQRQYSLTIVIAQICDEIEQRKETDRQRRLLQMILNDTSQEKMAQTFGVTDRTIRNWIADLHEHIKRRLMSLEGFSTTSQGETK